MNVFPAFMHKIVFSYFPKLIFPYRPKDFLT